VPNAGRPRGSPALAWLGVAFALAIGGCALPAGPGGGATARLRVEAGGEDRLALPASAALTRPGTPGVDILLLGEIHDNPVHHRLRLAWLRELAERGDFVVAMEQLDQDRQPALEQARAGGADVRETARAGGFDFNGWEWPHYEPIVSFALARRLPLVAANLSKADTSRIARGQPHPLAGAQPSDWSELDRAAVAQDIRGGHCGLLPERAIEPMARAQQARDAQIARAIAQAHAATGLPVVLIAGNGHVRRDRGVPRYLRDLVPRARVMSIGLVESPAAADAGEAGAYDVVVRTPEHVRPDPCEGLRRRASR
jgi:uncharacterized iron-regulated protein